MHKRAVARSILVCVVGAILAAPLAFIVTFMMAPFWSWMERTTGIESVGHGAPATWCFVAVYAAVATAAISLAAFRSHRSRRE